MNRPASGCDSTATNIYISDIGIRSHAYFLTCTMPKYKFKGPTLEVSEQSHQAPSTIQLPAERVYDDLQGGGKPKGSNWSSTKTTQGCVVL